MSTLRVGLAGAGWVSAHHLTAWKRVRDAAVVAVCDPDSARAHARAAEFAIPAVYTDAAAMLHDERLDVLDVSAPVDAHVALVLQAAERGLDVLCQKPLAPSLAEAERLVADTHGRIRLMVHENWRFRPPYRQVAAWQADGLVGEILQCRLSARSSGLLSPDGATTPESLVRQPFLATLPRLIVAELLIHHLDVVRWLVGPLTVTAAQLGRNSNQVVGEDAATILLRGPAGASVVVDGNMSASGYPPTGVDLLELIGAGASVFFDGLELTLAREETQTLRYDPTDAYEAAFTGAISHFVGCIRSGAPFETDGVDNLETLKLVDATYAVAGSP
jgi:D-apiose dehydrogenase